MKNLLKTLLVYFFRGIFWLRYRIKVKGLEKLSPKTLPKKGGVLFFPNHPAFFIDPAFITASLWPKYEIRPMIAEYMYYHPLINPMMRLMKALPVPSFDYSSNSLKRRRNENIIQTVVNGVQQGDNFLIYPAGRVKASNYESIGGASAAQRILKLSPDANVVLVRTKGLWGSSFSRAQTGEVPSMFGAILSGVKHIFQNLIFFTPRRTVEIEFEPAPADFPYSGSKMEINRWLEKYYNKPDHLTPQEGDEPGDSLMLVRYSLWSKALPKVSPNLVKQLDAIDISKVPDQIRRKVYKKIGEVANVDPLTLKGEMTLSQDLGLDSLSIAEIGAFLQEEYNVGGIPYNELTTVDRVVGMAAKKLAIEEEKEDKLAKPTNWNPPKEPSKRVYIREGETIPEVFLNVCDERGSQTACADLRTETLTYKQLKMRALLVADYIKTLPGDYIGILLPASVGAEILVLATQLAGKIPLMVNWTVGPRHLQMVSQLSNVQVVLSSWAFLDRLGSVDLTGIDDKLIMLEDVRSRFGLTKKIKALFRSMQGKKRLMRKLGLENLKKSDPAVLLFTSGTESMPKGVPLTHENVLSCARSVAEGVHVESDDVLLSILPPFHSFGFTITGLLPLLIGIRVAFSPDPTNGAQIVRAIVRWKATIMGGTPTFIKAIMRAATPEQLETVRFAFTGAEKAPSDLFTLMTQYGKTIDFLLEGYGITECSPVLSFTRQGEEHIGVGKASPRVELLIVHPEMMSPLPQGETGMILAHGPNIFNGYLNPGMTPPFIEIQGKRWYKTGDLGFLDEKGNLTISGRLSRFIKVGSEMFSLAAIEEGVVKAFMKKGFNVQEQATTAITAKEIVGEKPKITLFTTLPVELEEVNRALRDEGFSNLLKITHLSKLPEIPLTGTGKINYRLLDNHVESEPKG